MGSLLQIVLLGISACLISSAHAVKQGHSRLISPPGMPLEIHLPVTELTAEDLNALKVELASPALWTQSGLTPPVSLEQLQVSMKPGTRPDGRIIVVQSSQPSNRPVIDVLLTLSTVSGSRQLQVSLLQPEFAPVDLASSRASIMVQPGDTLYGIAQRNLVPGATIHQMLWALYEANPSAFISENMNLLRAGALLSIPDAKTVLAIDPAMSRTRFADHDARFKSWRGKRVGSARQPPVVGTANASSGKVTPKTQQSTSEQTAEDRLRLSTNQQDRESDQQASRKKDIAENQSRVGELQQNIQQMQQALGQSAGAGSAMAGGAGTGAQAGSALANSAPNQAGATSNIATPPASQGSAPGVSSSTSATPNAVASSASGVIPAGTSSSAVASSSSTTSAGSHAGTAAGGSSSGGNASKPGLPSASGAPSTALEAQKESAVATQWLKDNLLVVLTALLAILAFLIGMRMRRDSSRRDDESDDPDASEQVSPAAKTAFEKKLQSIDLNLDAVETPAADSKKPAP